MPKTRFPSQVVARIWDWLRKTFVIDWSRVKRKQQIKTLISERKRFLQSVISYKRTVRGVSPSEAQRELKGIEQGEKELKEINPKTGKHYPPYHIYKKGWYQIKPLARMSIHVRSHAARNTTIRAYNRDYMRWTTEQKRFVSERKGMASHALRDSFNQTFVPRSYHSIRTMQRRV